jgi:nicotinamide riboside transporter PnuC
MELKNEKIIAIVSCVLGVLSVVYGMMKDNDVLFMVGLFFVVGGYLIIRRKLKGNGKRKIR